jgi:hypothetical protein
MSDVARSRETLPMRIFVGLIVVVTMLLPIVLVGAGGWLLWQRQTGDRVRAEVIACDLEIGYKRSAEHCTARWTQDGIERTGPIQASGEQEVGETITATVRGGELYSTSLALPLILLGLGLPLCYFPYAWVRSRLAGPRQPRQNGAR